MKLGDALGLSKIAIRIEGRTTYYATNMAVYAEVKKAKAVVGAYKVEDMSKIINCQDWRPIGRLGDNV